MTDAQATALIKAVEQLADYVDLRDKPNHPLNRIANLLSDIHKTLNLTQGRMNDELAGIRDLLRDKS